MPFGPSAIDAAIAKDAAQVHDRITPDSDNDKGDAAHPKEEVPGKTPEQAQVSEQQSSRPQGTAGQQESADMNTRYDIKNIREESADVNTRYDIKNIRAEVDNGQTGSKNFAEDVRQATDHIVEQVEAGNGFERKTATMEQLSQLANISPEVKSMVKQEVENLSVDATDPGKQQDLAGLAAMLGSAKDVSAAELQTASHGAAAPAGPEVQQR